MGVPDLKAADIEAIHVPIQSIIGERIDQLLDLLLLARSLNDSHWENDLVGQINSNYKGSNNNIIYVQINGFAPVRSRQDRLFLINKGFTLRKLLNYSIIIYYVDIGENSL